MKTVRPKNDQEQRIGSGSASRLSLSDACQHPRARNEEEDRRQPQEMLLSARHLKPAVQDQIVKWRMLVLAGAAKIKAERLENRLRRTIDDGALVVHFGKPPI